MLPAHALLTSSPGCTPRQKEQNGFTLVELSVLIAIIAVVAAGTFSMGASAVESARRVSTQQKLDAIETALMAFRLANNRLPCPGDATLTDIAANSTTYGFEANNALGTCIGGSPAANASYIVPSGSPSAAAGTTIAEGAVPVRALNLPDEFQFDGWGRKISYAVWTPLTATNAFVTYGISPSCGAITVENAGHGNRSTAGAYALISYGPDGHGGYLKNGSRYNVGSSMTNVDEIADAHYSNAGADTGYAATYIQKDYSTYTGDSDAVHPFGHTVRYKERWQMQDAYDTYSPSGNPCKPGFRIDGVTASEELGVSVYTADINGDGLPDLIIVDGSLTTIYVIFGQSNKNSFPNPFLVSSLDGSNGFKITGFGKFQHLSTGNINGDSNNGNPLQDIVITTSSTNCTTGSTQYVIFGQATYSSGAVTASGLTNATSPKGMSITNTRCATSAVGDINKDGYDDILINYGALPSNAAYVIFGGAAMPSTVNVTTLAGGVATAGGGFKLTDGSGNYTLGYGDGLAIGDLNQDGIKDILIGSYDGYAYAIWGQNATYSWPASIDMNALPADGSVGVRFNSSGGVLGHAYARGCRRYPRRRLR